MARSHFSRLAHAPGQGVVSICRHGLVHLTWENLTIRLEREVFRRLGRLLERGLGISSPIPIYDEDLAVGFEQSHFRITVDSVELTLTPESFLTLRQMTKEALERMEVLMATGRWEAQDDAEPLSLASLDELEPRFSLN
jgi:hypothetical protein